MKRKNKLTIAIATAVFAGLGVVAVYAQQDKYALKTPDGIAFSDFRGYEDWAVVSSARTDEVLKVIVANPAMIEAYETGIPGNGEAGAVSSIRHQLIRWSHHPSSQPTSRPSTASRVSPRRWGWNSHDRRSPATA
jgi:hypothetical protein